eukprot:scaffold168645_cov44-Tisochrysis_lutea.AAC.2
MQAWATTTATMMKSGLGMSVKPEDIDQTNPREYGYVMRKGKLDRSPERRRNGDLALWETSSMAQSSQVYGEDSLA